MNKPDDFMKVTPNANSADADLAQDLMDYSEKIVKKYKQNNPPIEFIPQYYLNAKQNHFSPSQDNLPLDVWMHNYIYRDQEWRRNAKVPNPNMTAGNGSQTGVDAYVFKGADAGQAAKVATSNYKKCKKMYKDKKLEHFEANLEIMPQCVHNGIAALEEIEIKKEKDITTEIYCEYIHPGIEVVTIGRTDLATSKYLVELKTKWFRKGAVRKDGSLGFNKVRIPEEPDFNYLCQVAFYWKATGLDPILIYHTGCEIIDKKKNTTTNTYKIFSKENCEQLTPAAMEEYLEHSRQVQLVRQNLLKISSDPKVLAQHIQPDFKSFYWNDLDEQQLAEAKALWEK